MLDYTYIISPPFSSLARFVSVHDGFVRAVALCQNTAKNTDVAEVNFPNLKKKL